MAHPQAPARWCCFRQPSRVSGRMSPASPSLPMPPPTRSTAGQPASSAISRKRSALYALFPFGGPPWQPFYDWALRSGEAWRSPVSLLVHHRMGLWASYRGALALPEVLYLPAAAQNPCVGCAAPCRTACPVAALGPHGYNVSACHGFLDTPAGADCLSFGCDTRRACPPSAAYGRLAGQSAWHMRQFHQ